MPIIDILSTTKAVELLKEGKIVVYPTETAYALGADATNKTAVENIYKLKVREVKKPLAVLVEDLEQAKKFFRFPNSAILFAKKYWPGPVTLILPIADKRLKTLNKNNDKVGVRASSSKVANELAKRLGKPIVSTSANISGLGTPYSRRAVYKQFSKTNETVYFLDKGSLPRRATSAVLEVSDNSIKIYRSNPILKKCIINVNQ
jgi:L-threonylcarbamoyladenylate synthase